MIESAKIAGHPTGIFVLFLAEMWERFSYYGMRALLIYYLIEHFRLSNADAVSLYGAYTALVYGACMVGGALSDRYYGQWRSIVLGGTLVLAGHLGLAAQGLLPTAGGQANQLFFMSLGLIIAGTGLFKPSSSALVGALYPAHAGKDRQTGYYIYYVGMNLGAALAALFAGYLGQTYGWSYGFGAAAAGMALGLATLGAGRRHLQPHALQPAAQATTATRAVLLLVFPMCAALLVQSPPAVGFALLATLVGALAMLGLLMRGSAEPAQRDHMFAILLILGMATLFWSLFEQAGSSLALFADRHVDLRAGPLHLTSSQTQFFNPVFILLGTPAFALLWSALARRGLEPSAPWKFVFGLAQAALGFAVLVLGICLAPAGGPVTLVWLAAMYLLHTTGELCLSPTAMSELARLAPGRVSSLVMGLWLFTLAAGNFLAGAIAGWITAVPSSQAAAGISLSAYAGAFGRIAVFAGAVALILMASCSWLKRKMEAS